MKIHHIAIWVDDIELIKQFYTDYFSAIASDRYHNSKKRFTSYFLSFRDSDCKIEIMHMPDIIKREDKHESLSGLAHIALSVGSRLKVDELTEKLRKDGYIVKGEPRVTGDGFYESVILDPEDNLIEITE
ncbi:MAG: VOC family protein [Bacteroidales bacterium]|jgi:lactoylglutathione lyase|nr:VOC family protein [Bacteroidales bacterium]